MTNREMSIEAHFQLLQTLLHDAIELFPGCAEVERRKVLNRKRESFGTMRAVFTFHETENWHGELLELIRFLIEGEGLFWATSNQPFGDSSSDEFWFIAHIAQNPVSPGDTLTGSNHAASKISPGMALLRAYLGRHGVRNIPPFDV